MKDVTPMQPFSKIEPDASLSPQVETSRWVVWSYPSQQAFMNASGPADFDRLLTRYGYYGARYSSSPDIKVAKFYKTKGAATGQANRLKARGDREAIVYEVKLRAVI